MNPRTTKDKTLNLTPLAKLGYPCLIESSQYTSGTKTLLRRSTHWLVEVPGMKY